MSSTYILLGTAAGLEDVLDPVQDVPELKILAKADGEFTKDESDRVTAAGELDPGLIQFSSLTGKEPLFLADGGGGLPAFELDGIERFMLSPSISFGGSFSMFAVAFGATDQNVLWAHPNDPPTPEEEKIWLGLRDGLPIGTISTVGRNTAGGEKSQVSDNSTAGIGSSYKLWRQECLGSHATNKIWVNRVDTGAGTFGGNDDDPVSSVAGQVVLGAFLGEATGGSFFLDGRIREFALCVPRLSLSVSRRFENYLAGKWGPFS